MASRVMLLFAALAVIGDANAQDTLGTMLDAGGKRMSPDQFKTEVVQRTIAGPTSTGAAIEMIYIADGRISGALHGTSAYRALGSTVDGEWRIDDAMRVCTTLRVQIQTGTTLVMTPRCQYWFKLGDKYYFADSDTDRSAKVLSRTIKQ